MHALGTAEVVQQHLDNPLALMLAQDSMTETRLTPWYRNTIEIDRTRIARFNASIEGRPEPQPTDPPVRIASALLVAMLYDADIFRAAVEMRSLLALPQEVMARPGMVDRIPGGRRHSRGGGASWAVSPGATPYAGIEKREGGSVAGQRHFGSCGRPRQR
jgi:hypothetical protein